MTTHHKFSILSIIIVLAFIFSHPALAKLQWQTLAPGIEYTKITHTQKLAIGSIHAFRIDLTSNKLDLALAAEHNVSAATVKALAQKNNALIAINGGFFTPELHPIGLRVKQGAIKSKLKTTSWWGIFYIVHNTAKIVSQRDFANQQVDFAVQGGPRLVVDGTVTPKLKSGADERTALGINSQGKIILAVTDGAALDTADMAKIMQAPEDQNGLACVNALNLDGGNSSQLYAKIGDFYLNIPGYSFITDAVLVMSRG